MRRTFDDGSAKRALNLRVHMLLKGAVKESSGSSFLYQQQHTNLLSKNHRSLVSTTGSLSPDKYSPKVSKGRSVATSEDRNIHQICHLISLNSVLRLCNDGTGDNTYICLNRKKLSLFWIPWPIL